MKRKLPLIFKFPLRKIFEFFPGFFDYKGYMTAQLPKDIEDKIDVLENEYHKFLYDPNFLVFGHYDTKPEHFVYSNDSIKIFDLASSKELRFWMDGSFFAIDPICNFRNEEIYNLYDKSISSLKDKLKLEKNDHLENMLVLLNDCKIENFCFVNIYNAIRKLAYSMNSYIYMQYSPEKENKKINNLFVSRLKRKIAEENNTNHELLRIIGYTTDFNPIFESINPYSIYKPEKVLEKMSSVIRYSLNKLNDLSKNNKLKNNELYTTVKDLFEPITLNYGNHKYTIDILKNRLKNVDPMLEIRNTILRYLKKYY